MFADADVMATLRAVVAEMPDYIYASPKGYDCLYVHTDADGQSVPGCLVGHVLNRLGIDLAELGRHEGATAEWFGRPDGDARYISERAALALGAAQSAQDDGDSWADALQSAIDVYGRTGDGE